ncbi:ferredoxin [Anaerofustis sp. LCP19S3_F7]|uniref:ferredoxin n=1 Tax=Anaerofustis sp. LCP19S3_F7 TaxID=3440247 RepID=UPI003F91476D
MKLRINKDSCISCGLCVSLCEDIFEIESDGKSGVIRHPGSDSEITLAREAIESCPVNAISEY